jgi:quinol monooxygenase YgiN
VIAVIAKLTAAAGRRDDLVDALRPLVAHIVDDEPGTSRYILHTDDTDTDAVWFYETYDDDDALQTHMSSGAMLDALTVFGPLLDGAPELIRVTPVVGKGLD